MFHRPKSDEPLTEEKKAEENLGSGRIENEAAAAAPASDPQSNSVQQSEKKEESSISSTKKEGISMSDQQNKETDQQASRSLDIPASGGAFPQRPAAAPRYPGAYNAQPSEGAASSGEERKLLIGQGITMSGEIDSCDILVVEGTVEASLRGAQTLDIAESGVFYGAVEIDEATISGRFEGDIVVNGRLTITSTGSITGSIAYREMAMEAGAMIDGKVSPLSAASAAKADKPRARKNAKAASAADEASDGNQLPFGGTAAAA